jgi:hypothetical protein
LTADQLLLVFRMAGRSGGHMGDEVREGWFAGFAKVNLVAGPASTALFAQVGFGIIW